MKIQNRLLLLVTLVTVIPTVVFTAIFFFIGKQELSTFIYDRVVGVNEVKKSRIETFYRTNAEHITALAELPRMKSALTALSGKNKNLQSADLQAQAQLLKTVIAEHAGIYTYDDIKLVDNTYRIVFVTNPDYNADLGTTATEGLLTMAKDAGSGLHVSRPFKNQRGDSSYEMYFATPVKDQDHHSLGIVVMEVDVQSLFAEINDSSGLSSTGESVLAVNDDYSALMLTPLKYDQQAALSKRITFGEKNGGAIQNSVRGQEGRGEVTDYRGVQVFAAWSSIPDLNWGIVTKIDKTEALSSLYKVGTYIEVTIPLIVLLMLLIFFVAVRRELFTPLLHLATVAMKYAYGDSDPDVDPKLMTPKDHLGQLAIALHNLRRTLRHGPPATADHLSEAPENYHHDLHDKRSKK